jgi:transcriptional regulator with XRE-family HTH domain
MNYFASNIKFLRKRKGLQQAKICILIEFKQSTWSGYENGFSKPNFKDLLKIIDFFEVSASELLEMDLSNVTPKRKWSARKRERKCKPKSIPNCKPK